MPRNYKKEAEWERENYSRFQVKLNKQDSDALTVILNDKGINFSEWVRQKLREDDKEKGEQ